ncbi:MAG: PaaI family thioesterase [Leptospirales bacterium]|nr:PaaI family thioesterase [Leptospirales bacterium]
MAELLYQIVPSDLFTFKKEGSFEEQAQHLIDQCHPGATNMKILKLSGELAEADIPFAQSNRALHGLLHGGAYFTVGDTLTAIMCFFFVEKEGDITLTMDASIRYLRPIQRETVRARARLTSRKGNQLSFVCDFFNDANKRAAQAKYRYIIASPAAT